MKHLMAGILGTLLLFMWISGVVLAHGFWSTLFSIWMPPYSWYLVVEKVFIFYGII